MKTIDYSLYLVTDRGILGGTSLSLAVQKAIEGGAGIIQLREKNITSRAFYTIAAELLVLTRAYDIPLVINDRLDIAMALGAQGVHLGQQDMPVKAARKLAGDKMLLGVSTATVKEAMQAEQEGADYIGVGALFPTSTKEDTRKVSVELLAQIKQSVKIPVIAIGGINEYNAALLKPAQIDGIAVVSAILGKPDIKLSTSNLKKILQK